MIINTQTYLNSVIAIAKQAGDAIMQVYAGDISVESKADASPLTQADLAAHHIIEQGLNALSPEIPVLSEESASLPFNSRSLWQQYWLVDPLDGTKEFIKRNGEFTVNIALIHEHQAVLGVVYAPALNLLYYANEKGAFKQDGLSPALAIQTRALNPKDIRIAGSRSHAGAEVEVFLQKVESKLSVPKIISMGSSLKMCMVAEGSVDIYPRLGLTSEWDTAAAHCVLTQAGGAITDLKGRSLTYNSKESLLNPHFLAIADTNYDWTQYFET